MTQQAHVSPRLLLNILAGLGTLSVSPIGRTLLAQELRHSLRRSQVGHDTLEKITLMYEYFRDPAEPAGPKMMVGAALLYLVIPNRFIPRWTTFIGLTDEFAAIAIIWQRLQDVLQHYAERRAQRAGVLV